MIGALEVCARVTLVDNSTGVDLADYDQTDYGRATESGIRVSGVHVRYPAENSDAGQCRPGTAPVESILGRDTQVIVAFAERCRKGEGQAVVNRRRAVTSMLCRRP